tara:strand:- start:11264 stop:11875 length:612 start_codon:yes stop_codon:yes gene_type:complete
MSYWGKKDTTITFCEGAYNKSVYIAEYYNSLSGFIYLFVGLYFLQTKLKNIGYTLVFLGLGTVCLHATQRWYGQYLDELSMLYLSYQIIVYIRQKQHKTTSILWIPLGLSIYLHNYNIIFILMFFACQTYIFFMKKLNAKKNYESTAMIYNKLYKCIFLLSIICWILDHLFCEYTKQYYLHSWWHIGTGLSIFFGLNELLICY